MIGLKAHPDGYCEYTSDQSSQRRRSGRSELPKFSARSDVDDALEKIDVIVETLSTGKAARLRAIGCETIYASSIELDRRPRPCGAI
jgi:hypothetical protein